MIGFYHVEIMHKKKRKKTKKVLDDIKPEVNL